MRLDFGLSLLLSAALCVQAQLVVERHELDDVLQHLRATASSQAKRVAIIGAGAAGSSAAYSLRKYAKEAGLQVNITIFEKSSYVGGRSTTVNAFDLPSEPVELGASIFVDVNTILVEAAQEFGLPLQEADDRLPDGYTGPTLGIFNGDEFVFQQSTGTLSSTWDSVKLLWRYGLTPLKAQSAVKETVNTFLRMYDESEGFPWQDLTEEVERVGLLKQTGVTGAQLLKKKGITGLFATEIIQAATRVNYAQNLGVIHGVESMVSMAPQGAKSVVGGNWRIFASMCKHATKDIRLNTTVEKLTRRDNGTWVVKHTRREDERTITAAEDFDDVIIASPFQHTGLDVKPTLKHTPETIPYVKLHVTLLTTALSLNPGRFNLPPDAQVPLVVLTTLPPEDQERDQSKASHAGRSGFFSASMLRPITNPKTGEQEYLYKIFSAEPFTHGELQHILALPDGHAFGDSPEDLITWIYRKEWQSYPVEWPRVTFEKSLLARGLWYTGGMDSFISTMETNALMGKNVAKLLVNTWAKKDVRYDISNEAFDGGQSLQEQQQHPLNAEL